MITLAAAFPAASATVPVAAAVPWAAADPGAPTPSDAFFTIVAGLPAAVSALVAALPAAVPALAAVLVAGVVTGRALALRRRVLPLAPLPGAGPGPATGGSSASALSEMVADSGYEFVTGERAMLPGPIRRAAVAHAREHRLDVLDLVPVDLPFERAFDLVRSLDPWRYRTDPLAVGRGAGFATVVSGDLLARAGHVRASLDPGAFGAVTARLRQFTTSADLAVVPSACPRGPIGRGRRAWLTGLGIPVSRMVATSVLGYLAVLSALVIAPMWGLLAVIAYCAVPYLVFGGTALAPCDLHAAVLLRLVREPYGWWRTLTEAPTVWERDRADRADAARPYYRAEIERGVERFLAPRREDCPWCASPSLAVRVRTGDMVHGKPGRFTLERCRDCGYVFQNPRLGDEGRAFYDRDHQDRPSPAVLELQVKDDVLRARARFAAAHVGAPRAWLDVGTGHGHFCRAAAALFPGTAFDGLDTDAGVEEGVLRGWLRAAHRCALRDLPGELAGRYDVISMYHYLEHSGDPARELDAAVKALPAGGHLLIEQPDPECRFGRLGRVGIPWLQPRHLDLVTADNLVRALGARGMRVLAVQRRAAHHRHDARAAVHLGLTAFAPDPSRPWAPGPPTRAGRFRRAAAQAATPPLLAAAALADRLVLPLVPGPGNAYRILARKDEG
ncbi:class I SAM-dependent methyltransferase [Spirillospora sp. NPDC052269]